MQLTWTRNEHGNYNCAETGDFHINRRNTKIFNLYHKGQCASAGTLKGCQNFAQQIADGTLVRNTNGNYCTPEVFAKQLAERRKTPEYKELMGTESVDCAKVKTDGKIARVKKVPLADNPNSAEVVAAEVSANPEPVQETTPDGAEVKPAPAKKRKKSKPEVASETPNPEPQIVSTPVPEPEPEKVPGRKRKGAPKKDDKETVVPTPEPVQPETNPVPTPTEKPVEDPTPKKPGKGKGKKTATFAQMREELETLAEPVQETQEADPAADFVKEKPKEKRLGAHLKERDQTGLKPIFQAGTSRGTAFGLPEFTRTGVVEWIETVVDTFVERGLWPVNSVIEEWGRWLTTAGFQHAKVRPTEGEYDLVTRVFKEVVANREEPEEWTTNYRAKKAVEASIAPKEEPVAPAKDKPVKGEKKPTSEPRKVEKTETVKTKGGTVKVEITEGKKGGKRFQLNVAGEPLAISSAMRWMGAQGWTFDEVRAALEKLGLTGNVQEPTIRAQVYSGRKGDEGGHGKVPELAEAQEKALNALCG